MSNSSESKLFDDLKQLRVTIAQDDSGDATRAVSNYFERLIEESQSSLSKVNSSAERRHAASLVAGFQASQRVMRHAWRERFGLDLPQ